MSRNHDAWESIPINGDFTTITADQVRELSGREPRLMMKFDHSAQLPPALREAGKFILPLKNGLYAILRHPDWPADRGPAARGTIHPGYHHPEPCPPARDFPRQTTFHLGTSEAGLSEMQHLDQAFNTGLLSEFLGEPALYPTIRGRKRSPAFSFQVGPYQLEVEGVQVEIDGGYEAPDCVVVVEAKIGECEDFHLRQLYYPYRFWQQRSEKRVRPVFFTFEPQAPGGVYRFREYAFEPAEVYGPPRLIKAAAYRLVEPELARHKSVPVKRTIPVPQADKLSRIAEVPILVALGYDTSKALAERLELDPRQGAYYLNAACSLGLLEPEPFRLSELGRQFVDNPTLREALLARAVLGVPLVGELMISLLLSASGTLDKGELVTLMRRSTELGESTATRRAQTLWAWLSWLAERGCGFRVENERIALCGPPLPSTPAQPGQLELF